MTIHTKTEQEMGERHKNVAGKAAVVRPDAAETLLAVEADGLLSWLVLAQRKQADSRRIAHSATMNILHERARHTGQTINRRNSA